MKRLQKFVELFIKIFKQKYYYVFFLQFLDFFFNFEDFHIVSLP